MKTNYGKALRLTVLGVSFICCLSAYAQVSPCFPAPSGIAAWYPAESDADDIVGGNNGTINGGVTFATGEVGNAFLYDGTTGYISVPSSSSLDVGTSNGMTIECWIKPDHLGPVGNAGRPILEYDTSSTQGTGLWFEDNYILLADLKDTSGTDHLLATPSNSISTNVLQHIAVTYDKTSGDAFLYIDGVQMASANFGTITPQTSFPLYLGKRAVTGLPGSGDLYNGLLDEVTIYNRALSACEIQSIYLVGTQGKCH